MIDFLDTLYSIKDKNWLLKKIRFYSFFRLSIKIAANFILPSYLKITKGNKAYSIIPSYKKEPKLIVSLTSFPARIDNLWIVVESILRQKMKPDMIVLWLSINQFPNMASINFKLIKLQKRGLIIRLVEDDLRAHKKYYYALKYFPNDFIITVDDDIIYNSKIISHLVELSREYPRAVCCNLAESITFMKGNIAKYVEWPIVDTKQHPNFGIIAVGAGGILYPPNSLNQEVFNVDVFRKICFQADDIWLNFMARINKTKIAKTDYNSNYLPVINKNNITLNSINLSQGLNDMQLNSLREYYINKLGCDLFEELYA